MRVGIEFRLTPDSWGVHVARHLSPGAPSQPQVYSVSGFRGGTRRATASPAYVLAATVQPPRKIKDVLPVYPAIAQEARVQGVVMLEVKS